MMYILIAVLLFLLMFVYARMAETFRVAVQSESSDSHAVPAIRGGGIIFLVSIIIGGILYPDYLLPVAGAAVISIPAFFNDGFTLSSKIRVLFYIVAISMLFQFSPVFIIMPWWAILILYLLVVGLIYAYRSMDRIQGMTGLYGLVVLAGLQYVNIRVFDFVEDDLIWFPTLCCAVFLCFNLFKKISCKAGEAGSVTLGFWIAFLLLQLIFYSGKAIYILFLAVYAMDAIYRLALRTGLHGKRADSPGSRENKPDKRKWYLPVIYSLVQAGLIALIIRFT